MESWHGSVIRPISAAAARLEVVRAAYLCLSPSEIAHPAIDNDRFVMTCLLVVPTGRPDYSAAMRGVSSVVAK